MILTDVLAVLVVLGEWTGLIRGALGGPYYAAALDVGLLALVAVATVRAARQGRFWPLPLIAMLVLAYMALAAIQILNPNVPAIVVGLEGYRKTAFTMLALFVVLLADRGNAVRFYSIVALGSIPAFLWAIRQALVPLPMDLAIIETTSASAISFHSGSVLRAFSPTAGPFHLGVIAGSVLIISLVRSRSGTAWWALLAAFAGLTLGLTVTRANIAAGLFAILVVVALARPWSERIRMATRSAPAALTCLVAALLAVGALGTVGPAGEQPGGAGSSSSQSAVPTASAAGLGEVVEGVTNPLEDRSLQFRLAFWREQLAAMAERPLGYGTSAAADGFDHHYEGSGSTNFEPHSIYFKAALELGIPGVVLLLAILTVAVIQSVRALRSDRLVGTIALGVLTIVLVSGLTGPMLDAYPMNVLFWATIGWVARVRRADPPTLQV